MAGIDGGGNTRTEAALGLDCFRETGVVGAQLELERFAPDRKGRFKRVEVGVLLHIKGKLVVQHGV